jgi:hypothetical protein
VEGDVVRIDNILVKITELFKDNNWKSSVYLKEPLLNNGHPAGGTGEILAK